MSDSSSSSSRSPSTARTPRQIQVRHNPGVTETVGKVIQSERELKRLIQGEDKPDLKQILAVVSKLQVVIADYLDSGKPLKIILNPVEILSALDAAIQEASGHPSPWPDGADARTFFIHGLYDEIIQQPSNIFETRLFPDGSERYVPVSKSAWKACLELLRQRIVEKGTELVKRHSAGAV